MAKNDFDIDFDFEEEYGFDPKAVLGEELDDEDLDFSDLDAVLVITELSATKEVTAKIAHINESVIFLNNFIFSHPFTLSFCKYYNSKNC